MSRRGVACSADLRERVLGFDSKSQDVRARFGASASYVINARRRLERTGERGGRQPVQAQRMAGHQQAVRAEVCRRVDAMPAELRDWMVDERGVQVGITALWNEIARLGLTLKERRSGCRAAPAGPRGRSHCLARGSRQPEPRPTGIHRLDLVQHRKHPVNTATPVTRHFLALVALFRLSAHPR